jgi:hypothetical protein
MRTISKSDFGFNGRISTGIEDFTGVERRNSKHIRKELKNRY